MRERGNRSHLLRRDEHVPAEQGDRNPFAGHRPERIVAAVVDEDQVRRAHVLHVVLQHLRAFLAENPVRQVRPVSVLEQRAQPIMQLPERQEMRVLFSLIREDREDVRVLRDVRRRVPSRAEIVRHQPDHAVRTLRAPRSPLRRTAHREETCLARRHRHSGDLHRRRVDPGRQLGVITHHLVDQLQVLAVAQLAADIYGTSGIMPQGLGTGQLFTDNIPMRLEVKGEKLYIKR